MKDLEGDLIWAWGDPTVKCPVEYLNLWWDGRQWVVVTLPDDFHQLTVAQIVAGLSHRRMFDFDLLSPEQLSAYNDATR